MPIDDITLEWVWVFMGEGGMFPAGIFRSKDGAMSWISERRLSGTLTRVPLDISIYDLITRNGYFSPKYPSQQSPAFIGRFTSAYLEHYHIENGASC
jgi:hypothetical protein